MTSRKGFLTGCIAASFASLVTPARAFQANGGDTAPEMEGAWLVQLPGGLGMSLQTYCRGGAVLENNSVRGINQPGTTGHGTWAKVGPHRFTKTVEWFSMPPGQPTLRVELKELIEVTGDRFVILAAQRRRYFLNGQLQADIPCESAGGFGERIDAGLPPCP